MEVHGAAPEVLVVSSQWANHRHSCDLTNPSHEMPKGIARRILLVGFAE